MKVKFKNIRWKNDILKMVNLYIVETTETTPFHSEYLGKCYRVTKQVTVEESQWIKNCVVIGYDEKEETPGWCLYDSQYVTLVPLI